MGKCRTETGKAALAKARALELDGKKVEFYLVGRKGRPVINRTYPGRIVANYDTTGVKEQKQKHLRDRHLPSLSVDPSLNKFDFVPPFDNEKICNRGRGFDVQIINGKEMDPCRKHDVSVC